MIFYQTIYYTSNVVCLLQYKSNAKKAAKNVDQEIYMQCVGNKNLKNAKKRKCKKKRFLKNRNDSYHEI